MKKITENTSFKGARCLFHTQNFGHLLRNERFTVFQSRKVTFWIALSYETLSIHKCTGSSKTTWRTGSSGVLLRGHWDSKAPPKVALSTWEVTFSKEENNTAFGCDADV